MKPKFQNWSRDWYVVTIKMNEKQTALFIGILSVQNCGKHFKRPEGKNSRTQIGFNTFMKDATKRGSSIARLPKNVSLYIRAIQGHTGGNLTALELMGHVAIPYKIRKEFQFHRGCSYHVQSVLRSGLIAGGRESKEGRLTIFFTPLNPFWNNPDEEKPSDDLSKPRKVHYYSKWKTRQDAVHWIKLAQELKT